jgi:hypothetical protein
MIVYDERGDVGSKERKANRSKQVCPNVAYTYNKEGNS